MQPVAVWEMCVCTVGQKQVQNSCGLPYTDASGVVIVVVTVDE